MSEVFARAVLADAYGAAVRAYDEDGRCYAVSATDPRLDGIEIGPYVPLPERAQRVASVSAVSFLTVLSMMPAPEGSPPGITDAEAAVEALVSTMPKPVQIAWRRAGRMERADLIAMSGASGIWTAEAVDAALAAAAALPGSGPVTEPIPEVEGESLPEPSALGNALAVAAFSDPPALEGVAP
jgi:hypothetical protein